MFTKLISVEELKSTFTEILLNKTDKITKITEGSVVNGASFGVAKIGQKIIKDIAVLESKIFPDTASGRHLDDIARLEGVSQRFGSRQSSTYVRISGNVGTNYVAGTHVFKSSSGIEFDLESNYTIGVHGWGYVKVRSKTTGSNTNVDALTINQVSPVPLGHTYCINEFAASFGKDKEVDDVFRKRIKEGVNLLSKSTISQIEQVFLKINENVLKVYYAGIDDMGRTVLAILTENGIDLSQSEMNDIILRSEKYFSLIEFRPSNFNGYGVSLRNVQWQPIDISMRIDLESSMSQDEIRKDIQIRLNKYLDYRYWKSGSMLQWDDLLDIVKNTKGVRYVSDAHFFPSSDIQTDLFKLPRIRGFQVLDLDGNLIQNISGSLNPIYYPTEKDFSNISSILQTI